MIEHWERSVVTGTGPEIQAMETVLHKRGEDVMRLAMKRNPDMAACSRIEIRTQEAFTQQRDDGNSRRRKTDIPAEENQGEEWDW